MNYNKHNLQRPKRLLSIDGGGIRGIIAAEVLIKIEDILYKINPNWQCLADYFDFIGGTSTGAILAAGLAKGMSACELRDLYVQNGCKIFSQRCIFDWRRLESKYDPTPLEDLLQEEFSDITLGSDKLKTLLMIVAKNVTTDRTWFFVNNPNSKYFETNSKIPLWHIIRASSAAPTYFPPHAFNISADKDAKQYEFVDGGMSVFNNPSFQLFGEATQKEYGIGWETGEKNLLMISIGTGFSNKPIQLGAAKNYKLWNWAGYAVGTLMEDANLQQNILMKLISNIPDPTHINSEISAFSMPAVLKTLKDFTPKSLTYHRYTTSFTQERFDKLGISDINPKSVENMDCVDQIPALCRIGKAIASEQVREEHFKGFLHNLPEQDQPLVI